MSLLNVDKVDPSTGTALELGTSGDTITVPTGAGLTVTDEVKTNKISPATGTAFALGDSGDTFTVPSGATIVNSGTATGFGGGKIGQVLSASTSSTQTLSVTVFTDLTTLTVDITPVATSSKVLVLVTVSMRTYEETMSSTGNTGSGLRIERDGSAIFATGVDMAQGCYKTLGDASETGAGPYLSGSRELMFLDSPSSTSAVTYTVAGRQHNTSATTNYQYDSSASSITVMEILA